MVDAITDLSGLGLLSLKDTGSNPVLTTKTNFPTEDGLAPLKDTLALGSNYPNELHDPK